MLTRHDATGIEQERTPEELQAMPFAQLQELSYRDDKGRWGPFVSKFMSDGSDVHFG